MVRYSWQQYPGIACRLSDDHALWVHFWFVLLSSLRAIVDKEKPMGRAPGYLISRARRNRIIELHVHRIGDSRCAARAVENLCYWSVSFVVLSVNLFKRVYVTNISIVSIGALAVSSKTKEYQCYKESKDCEGYSSTHLIMPALRCSLVTGPDRWRVGK